VVVGPRGVGCLSSVVAYLPGSERSGFERDVRFFFFLFFIYVPLDLDPSHPPLALLTAHGFLFFRKKNLFGAKKKSNLQTSSLLARYLSWTLVPETRGREMEFIYLFCFFIIIIEAGRAWMMPP
jgi:hypothetical protein